MAVVLATLPVAAVRADEFDTLRLKWVEMLTGGTSYNPADPAIATAITSVANAANTQWTSMDKSPARTALWGDAASRTISADINTNYSRLRTMALGYATVGSSLKGNAALRADIIAGLEWMYANRYNENTRIYDNWWHFEIGSPQDLNDIVALLYDELTAAQRANYMRAVDKFTPNATTPATGGSTGTFTGANRMSKILVVVIRGILVKDDAKLRGARDAFSELFLYVTSGDGFYTDGSFIQHGKHAYNGSYGASLMTDIARVLPLLNGPNAQSAGGSSWRVTAPNLGNVFRWVYEAYEPLIYRGAILPLTQGRAISRSGSSDHVIGHGLMQSMLWLSELAPSEDRMRIRALLRYWAESDGSRNFAGTVPLPLRASAQQLMADASALPRGELRGNFVFANMDRVMHLAAGYGVGLSMSSTRVYTYESINNENLRGWHTGDGMLYLYNSDLTQFADSFWPTVNPRRLPGTTVDAAQARANASGQSVAPAPNWVGGASLGRFGVTGMQLAGWSNSLRAKKSWFMFDREIVCLGAGITSTDNRAIESIVENRLLNSAGNNALTVGGTVRPAALGWSDTMTDVSWAHLAGRVPGADLGYFFPGRATLNGLREARTGTWSDINAGGSTTALTRNYLTLWFAHGANPTNASYAYALLPGITTAQVADYAAQPSFTVLENSANIQAVHETSLGITAANFWNDGRASAGPITVDRKAAVLVQEVDGFIEVAVSDPTHAATGPHTVEIAAAAASVANIDAGVAVAQLAPTLRFTINAVGAHGRTFRARFATANVKPPAALTNLSTRAFLPSGGDALIAGFVVAGPGTKRLLIRGIGPALAGFGVAGALANPHLAIVNSAGATIAENDDWSAGAEAAELVQSFSTAGAFALPAGSRDAAVLVTVPAGVYSAVVRNGAGASGGVALVEVYDLSPQSDARLINLSSRIFAGSGAQAAIVGFALANGASRPVLVRAAGPALAAFNVGGALPDPQLHVLAADAMTQAQNDNWGAAASADETARVAGAVGAFAFPVASKDSAAVVTLRPGAYTAIVTEPTGATGTTLVEVYAAP